MALESRVIKTYMSFGLPVDPSNVKTLVDLDLSYALASTLVDWTDSRNLKEGLAKPLDTTGDREVGLKLRPEAKWSDGTPVTADQVVRSFEHARRLHAEDLKSLFEILDRVEAKDSSTVIFHLNQAVASSQIFHKLTEPMYGILFIRDDGSNDLSKTTGAYSLKSASKDELTLVANPHWAGREQKMADTIILRQPPQTGHDTDQDAFSSDPWPNLIASSSLLPEEVADHYIKAHFSIWNRNLDRVFFLSPGPRLANADGRLLFQAMNRKLDRTGLLRGLSGYHLSQQFFPSGYAIFDPEFQPTAATIEIPAKFKQKPLELLTAEGRVGSTLKRNLLAVIEQVTGHTPHFRAVPLAQFDKERAAGQYDILVAALPVNDPNVEGAVSFFFGMTPPLIPNAGEGAGDFKKRIVTARNLEESARDAEYRRVFTQSVQEGCLLPLFHFSSLVVARDGIDLSRVPTSDETVSFSKVRFK